MTTAEKYAVIASPFRRGSDVQGRVLSIHYTQAAAVHSYRTRHHGRTQDRDVIEIGWTNGEQARGPQIDWSKA